MAEKQSLRINAILNVVKSSLSIIFPLITYPYIYHVLNSENIGKVNFANSIVSYFSLFAMFGISQYAIREGAKIRNNKKKLQEFCNQVFTINVISTICSYIVLFVTVINVNKLKEYAMLICICSISIAFTTLGIEWINIIYEDFLYITIRSIFIHIILLLLIFIFIKDSNDVIEYVFLSILGGVLTGILNWSYCKKYIKIRLTNKINFVKHKKPIFILFINTLITNIYVNSDITMIGWFVGDYSVGIYSLAVKIYAVIKGIMDALYSVTIPRVSYYLGRNDIMQVRVLYTKLVSAITLLLLPASAGLIAISPEIIYFMGGSEYMEAVISLRILGISLIGAIFGGLITFCLNIPLGHEKVNFQAIILSAITNVVLNFVMIPTFKQNGAAITTAISEFLVLIYCLIKIKRNLLIYLNVEKWKNNVIHGMIGVMIVFLITGLVRHFINNVVLCLVLIIVGSITIYGVLLLVLKNEIIYLYMGKMKVLSKYMK